MASMNSTVDGMGHEELGQPGSQVSDLWLVGSITAENQISGLAVYGATGSFNNAHVTDAFVAGSISDHTGVIRPVEIQNAANVTGYRVLAGSVKIGGADGGPAHSGLITFTTNFADANWFMTLTPRTLTNPYLFAVADMSGAVPCVSGQRRASGCWVYAGSNTVIDWIAVGL